MAVTKLSLNEIRQMVRILLGETTASLSRVANSDTSTDKASLTKFVNAYGQSIPNKLNLLAQGDVIYPDFWRTSGSMTETSGSSTVTFPADYVRYISFYDRTNRRPLKTTQEVARWHLDRLKRKPEGPPEAIEILGVDSSQVWQATLWPPTVGGVTPDIEVVYWRMPANMPDTDSTTEYPDAPPQFHYLWVAGTVMLLMSSDDPVYERFKQQEQEYLMGMLKSAKAY